MASFPTVFETINDIGMPEINWLLKRTKEIKSLIKSDSLGFQTFFQTTNKIVACTFFEEHSTRTKLSFTRALQLLGAKFINFDSGTSSLKKGESLRETFLTLKAMGVNICIFRCPQSEGLSPFKHKAPFKLINAGDGMNEHPTQALLDLFTMTEENFDQLEGKTVAIVGDCLHSRVSHSLSRLLPQFGMKVLLVGPEEFLPVSEQLPGVEFCRDRDEAIKKCDLLYLLRIQTERHRRSDLLEIDSYIERYGVTLDHLKKLGREIPLYSPGPANIGVEIDEAAISSNLFVGHRQVENGVYMRMAIIEAMCSLNKENVNELPGGIRTI